MIFKVAVHLSDKLISKKNEIDAFLSSKEGANIYIQDSKLKPTAGTDCVIRLIHETEADDIDFYKELFAAYKNRIYIFKDINSLNETYAELMKDLSETTNV